jgi:hypothetical protein
LEGLYLLVYSEGLDEPLRFSRLTSGRSRCDSRAETRSARSAEPCIVKNIGVDVLPRLKNLINLSQLERKSYNKIVIFLTIGRDVKSLLFKSRQIKVASLVIINLVCNLAFNNPINAFQSNFANYKSFTKQEKNTAKLVRRGKFKVVYSPTKNQFYKEFQQAIKESQGFEEISSELNKTIAIPVNLTINFAECKEINAFYQPAKHQIVMCYELLEYFAKLFVDEYDSEEELGTAMIGATLFTFFHELGHALIDVLELPITGKEEDAVDQLATILLTEAGDEGTQAILAAAHWFLLQSSQPKESTELPFWDEHSLDMQRFYGIVCWLYGSNPKKYASLVKSINLPATRAQRCSGEYTQVYKSWDKLLSPYVL